MADCFFQALLTGILPHPESVSGSVSVSLSLSTPNPIPNPIPIEGVVFRPPWRGVGVREPFGQDQWSGRETAPQPAIGRLPMLPIGWIFLPRDTRVLGKENNHG